MKYTPKNYQLRGIQHVTNEQHSALFLDMGMGKTSIMLTALVHMLARPDRPKKVLVIAPLRVATSVWTGEIAKWDHTRHLKASKILGTAKQRIKALNEPADIYLINRENVPWLVKLLGMKWPFDWVIVDELSSFKNSKSQRFRALRMVRPLMKRITGLTGTPMPNGLLDLWAQMCLIDRGERLGKTLGAYRDAHFIPTKEVAPHVYDYELAKGSELEGAEIHEKIIYDKLTDICLSLRARDYLDLPPRMDVIQTVELSPEDMRTYRKFEREYVLELAGKEITAVSAGDLAGKLLQCAGGAIYSDAGEAKGPRPFARLHEAKLDALEELVEELNGRPAIVCYWFQHELERIKARLKDKYVVGDLTGDMDEKLRAWNAGEYQVMLVHPASAGHGLNMQDGGRHMIWYSNIRSTELYLQTVARLDRQGGVGTMMNIRLAVKGTADDVAIRSVTHNSNRQDAFLDYAKQLVDQYSILA